MVTTPRLLFVGGFPSGGTDLTKSVLNSHPSITIAGETPFLHRLSNDGFGEKYLVNNEEKFQTFKRYLLKNDIYNIIQNHSLRYDDLSEICSTITVEKAFYYLISKDSILIHGCKTPQLTEHLDKLYPVFPNALFLIVIRDVRDVCLSWEKKWGKDKILCASKWARRMEQGVIFSESVNGKRILFIKYEDFLKNTKMTIEQVCSFIGVNFTPGMLEHHNHTKDNIAGKINYGKKIDPNNFNKWKTGLSSKTTQRIEEIAGVRLEKFGYELSSGHLSEKKICLHERALGVLKDLYAMLFVGNRMLSKKDNLKMRVKSVFVEIKKRTKL